MESQAVHLMQIITREVCFGFQLIAYIVDVKLMMSREIGSRCDSSFTYQTAVSLF